MYKNSCNDKQVSKSVESQTECGFNTTNLIEATGELQLIQLDGGDLLPSSINRPTIELIKHFFNVLNTRESTILLQWPMFQRDISMIHSIAMLSSFMPQELLESKKYTYCNPLRSFRTLFFPWFSGRTRAIQQSILVDRKKLLEWNQMHVTRSFLKNNSSIKDNEVALDKLHLTIAHLQNLKKYDSTKFQHLAHPSLAEIYPLFRLGENEQRPFISIDREIFDRVSYRASLKIQTDFRSDISNPAVAPFGFFAVSVNAEPRRSLAAKDIRENQPDICVLDLNSAAMNRLGDDWYGILETFIKVCNKKFPKMPFLGLTNNTYYHNMAAKVLSSAKNAKNTQKSIIVRLSSDPITTDRKIDVLSNIDSKFNIITGDLSHSVRNLLDAAKFMKNPNFARTLRMITGNIRTAASLPSGFSDSYDILSEEYNQSQAESFLNRFSPSTVLNHISEVIDESGGNSRMKVIQAHQSVDSLYKKLENETPMGSLLQRVVEEIIEKSGRSIIVFNSTFTETIGKQRLHYASTNIKKIDELLETGRLQFSNIQNLEHILERVFQSPQRDEWRRMLVVAPSLDRLSKLLIEPWLPAELIVLCEKYFALNIMREYEHLSKFQEMTEYSTLIDRFENIYNAAKSEVDVRDSSILELEVVPKNNIEFVEKEIDLTEGDIDNETEIIELSLESNRILKVRTASKIIRVDQNAIANKLERKSANEIEVGNIIVVPDESFIVQAREILPIQVLAKSWVNFYHEFIKEKLPEIPGDNITDKAYNILEKIQTKEVTTTSVATVKNWLNVKKHMQMDPDVRRSNAPQNWESFCAFMTELKLDFDIIKKVWEIGIQPFRSDRRQAGQKMANAFITILIDPHSTTFDLDKDIQDSIFELQSRALDFAEEVVCINRGKSNE